MKVNNNFSSELLDIWTEKCDPLKVNNNFKNEAILGLPNVWGKDHNIVKIVTIMQKIASSILLKINIYSFGMKNKIKNLFQQPVDPKVYYHNLKEIINKGKAQLELNQEGSAANILHRERQLKKEISLDENNILEDLPGFMERSEMINFRLKRFANN